ncbi:MAG: helix-hairpin-helix domain-containing protein [Pseudomonadota bacterium]|nr:helix-hairpin-helix domain-containing protein [Pseudomonadota bacterium]
MIKKLMLAVAAMIVTMGFAFAQVDVNKADAAALDSVKGIGPKTSKLIIDERTKGGDFKDWADLEKRVKGIGAKNAKKLSVAGLQVGGKSMEGADMKAAEPKAAKPAKAMPDAKPAAKPAAAPAPAKM